MRLYLGPRKGRVHKNNYMPLYIQHTNNNRLTNKNQNNNDYRELGPIIKYILLAVIILTLLIVSWWILIPIGVILGIYLMNQLSLP